MVETEMKMPDMSLAGKILEKMMPGFDFSAIQEQVEGGLDEFAHFKVAIELLHEQIAQLDVRVSELENR